MSDEQVVTPPPQETAPPPETTPEAPLNVEDDAALDAVLQTESLELPEHLDGPMVSVKKVVAPLRAKVRELKALAQDAVAARQENEQLKAKHQETAPVIEAAKAIIQAAQQQPQQPPHAPQPPAEDLGELNEIARDFDLWKADGSPDLDRARRILTRQTAQAQRIAQETTAPMIVRSLQQEAQYNLARAKATKYPDGTAADPAILESLFGEMSKTAQGLQFASTVEGAQRLYEIAYARTAAARAHQAAKAPPLPKATPPSEPPLYTETAGGNDTVPIRLDANDKRVAKDLGMTEAEYAKAAAEMPWRKR